MWLIVFIIVIVVLILYITLDVIRVLRIKTAPVLPLTENISLSPDGIVRIYEYFRDSSLIPEGIELTEDFIIEEISEVIQYINSRYDCADFWCQLLYRLYKDFGDRLTIKLKTIIKETLTGFKFWMDMPGDDSMCYFSENHTLLFTELEFLIGQEWPDVIFSNSNLTGKEHMERGKTRFMYWVDQKFKFGFFEWYSNNYFNEDLGPLAQLVDYAEDEEVLRNAIEVMNLLLFEVVSHCIGNIFCVVSSRLYSDNKASNRFGNRIKGIMNALIFDDFDYDPITEAKQVGIDCHMVMCFLGMLRNGKYSFPKILKEIALDQNTRIIKSSNGLNPDEYKELGLIGHHEYQITAQFSNEIFVNPGFSMNTYKWHKKNGMFTNVFSYPMKFADIGIVRFTRLVPLLATILDKKFMPTGIALCRGNVYTYRTKNYMLSTAVKCHLDYCGTQHHVALATLKDDLNVFTLYPTTENVAATPGYWSGNRRMPMSVQDNAINMTIFRMAKRKRLGEFKNLKKTHTLFPKEKFDEILLEDKKVFGRAGDTYIAVISNRNLKYKHYDEESAKALVQHVQTTLISELLNDGANKFVLRDVFDLCAEGEGFHIYVTELSDNTVETFEEFIKRIKSNHFESDNDTLEYISNERNYHVDYSGEFKIDNALQDLEYKRFDSDYCIVDRMPEKIKIEFDESELLLENKSTKRFEKKKK